MQIKPFLVGESPTLKLAGRLKTALELRQKEVTIKNKLVRRLTHVLFS